MKRTILFLSVLIICISILAGSTLAVFTADATAHNVITTGGVKIALQEWADEEETKPFQNLNGIMPGSSAVKIVKVKNTGKSDAWVRIKITKVISLDTSLNLDPDFKPNTDLISLDFNSTDWTLKDGYYYYNAVLKPGEVTEPIFKKVTLDKSIGNEFQNAEIAVDITAHAVQAANNGTAATAAVGWPD